MKSDIEIQSPIIPCVNIHNHYCGRYYEGFRVCTPASVLCSLWAYASCFREGTVIATQAYLNTTSSINTFLIYRDSRSGLI